jgi:hypothetical protein
MIAGRICKRRRSLSDSPLLVSGYPRNLCGGVESWDRPSTAADEIALAPRLCSQRPGCVSRTFAALPPSLANSGRRAKPKLRCAAEVWF